MINRVMGNDIRATLAACVLVWPFVFPLPAVAQLTRVEVDGSIGFSNVATGGGPDLVTAGLGVSFWIAPRIGIGWNLNRGPGEERYDRPAVGGRQLVSSGNLFKQRAVLRYRRPLVKALWIVVSAGVLFSSRWDRTELVSGLPRVSTEKWDALSFDAVGQTRLKGRVSAQFGVSMDEDFGRTYFRPHAAVVVGF